tara:strand:+ start:150 stop:563 length:414 start_codon:yes stop_codon:yes gene_type:complete
MLNLKKLCVGISTFEMLEEWQKNEIRNNRQLFHTTRIKPKRVNEILPKGSLYWIIKNKFIARQKILEFKDVVRKDGKSACKIIFDHKLIKVANIPHRPFQGWRYLTEDKIPKDTYRDLNNNDIPPSMLAELNQFGVI